MSQAKLIKRNTLGVRDDGERITTPQRRRFFGREDAWGYLFILPQVIGLVAFVIIPVAFSLYLCFANWDFVKPPELVGTANIETVLSDPDFHTAVRNTFLIVLTIVPLTVVISLGLALLTNRKLAGLALFKAGFFLPMVTTSVAIAAVWYWLFAPDFGLINAFLSVLGIQGPGWLADPAWAKVAIVIMISWQSMGYYYILFLAGLKHIPQEYYDAAAIDGADRFAMFRYVTLPMISPTLFFVITTLLIGAFTTFDVAYVLTRGGPVNSTYTIVMYVYDLAFRYFRMGSAAVASWVLFIILFIITLVQFQVSKLWVNYDQQ
jgi:multiple sugar transport system permease protein